MQCELRSVRCDFWGCGTGILCGFFIRRGGLNLRGIFVRCGIFARCGVFIGRGIGNFGGCDCRGGRSGIGGGNLLFVLLNRREGFLPVQRGRAKMRNGLLKFVRAYAQVGAFHAQGKVRSGQRPGGGEAHCGRGGQHVQRIRAFFGSGGLGCGLASVLGSGLASSMASSLSGGLCGSLCTCLAGSRDGSLRGSGRRAFGRSDADLQIHIQRA